MHEVLRFWLRRGVDGFRIDVAHALAKDALLRDDPPHPDAARMRAVLGQRAPSQLRVYSQDRPEVHDLIRGFRRVLDEFDAVAVGEVYLLDVRELVRYFGTGRDQLHLAFNFEFLHNAWNAESFRSTIGRTETLLGALDAWPTWTLSNHDNERHATRYGVDNVKRRH
jgi:alpha-glucosidase